MRPQTYRIPEQPVDQYPEREPEFPCWLWSKETTDERWEHFQSWDNSRRPQFFGWSHWSAASVLNPPCNAPTPPEGKPGAVKPECMTREEFDEAIGSAAHEAAHPQPPAVEPWMEAAAFAIACKILREEDPNNLDRWKEVDALTKLIAESLAEHAPDTGDKRRLDWLEKHMHYTHLDAAQESCYLIQHWEAASARTAIDSAMRNDNSTKETT